jgi:uncharacterized protein (TIGR02001 family)
VTGKRVATCWLALVAAGVTPLAAAQTRSPSLSGYVTVASGYWKHGLAQTDGTSTQLGIDYQHHTGFFAGGWAANVDFAREYSYEQARDVEANAYVGYHRRRDDWSFTLALGLYAYPGTAIDYDYDELSATFGYRDRVFYTAASSGDYYALGGRSLDQQVSAAFPLRANLEITGGVGRFSVSGAQNDGTYWNVGVSKLFGPVALDLRYYDSTYSAVSYFGDPTANHYVVSFSYELRSGREN